MTEENKYLDTLFQSKFSGFEAEPPATVWNNVHHELHGKNGGSVNPVNLAMLAALVLISGLLGFSIMKDAPQSDSIIVFAAPEALETSNFSNTAQPSVNINIPANEKDRTSDSDIQHYTLHAVSANTNYAPSFSEGSHLAKMKSRRSFSVHTSLKTADTKNISVRDSKYHPRFAGVNNDEQRYNRKASWQWGMFFTPLVSFYADDSIPNQRSYTFDASLKWTKNEFFIESGLGLSFSSDDGKYNIDYEKFLGSYDDVYNVTYDTLNNGSIVPTYHTNVVNVYDSISTYKLEKTKNHYTYLQIPVYVGFHKQTDRFGWFVKGGPVFSLLMRENIPHPDAGNDRIIGLDQQMASRVNTYWQFAFSAGMTYQLSNKVSIAIEPTFRYYLNSQYERKYISTRHPYSLGLRTGLLFNF
ncbi:MAG: hypothetical protein ABFS05_00485 [Bacteroidota bacterium]